MTRIKSCVERLGIVLLFFSLWGCGASDGALGNLGVEGATCQSSPECSPPLQCIAGLCSEYVSSDTAGSVAVDVASRRPTASDGDGTVTDGKQGSSVNEDVDAGPNPTFVDSEPTNIFSDCEELGISDHWAGTFMGIIDFTIDPPIPGLLEEGALMVSGDLSFEIKCLDQKLVVAGEMNGIGEAVGEEGKHPYTSKLAGYYNPTDGRIEAELIDGVVNVVFPDNPLISVEVYYAGTLEGVLKDSGSFEGTWTGEETGNQLGATVEAAASGTWEADPPK